MQFWLKSASQQALNSLHCLFVAFDLSLAMRLLLTPAGPSDNVIGWIPRVPGFIPEKQHVRVCVCNDGKKYGPSPVISIDTAYYQRLLTKLCKSSNAVVETVSLQEISFFDESDAAFYEKLGDCDLFFMAGFTTKVAHVEAIYKRGDESMSRKRHEVANRIVTNKMAYWGSCGSAVSCGTVWEMDSSSRVLPKESYQMLETLADGRINYDACSGPYNVTVTDDLRVWHITSGTGLIIVMNDRVQHGEAFVCVKRHYTAYQELCKRISEKTVLQLSRLYDMVSEYRSEPSSDSACWRLRWGPGIAEPCSPKAVDTAVCM